MPRQTCLNGSPVVRCRTGTGTRWTCCPELSTRMDHSATLRPTRPGPFRVYGCACSRRALPECQVLRDRTVVAAGPGRAREQQGVARASGGAAHQVEQGVLLAVHPDPGQLEHVPGRGALPP